MSGEDPNRRDFLYVATAATGAVITGAAVWPLISYMNPDAETRALAELEVDVDGVEPGQQLTVMWRGKPVFIRRRTDEEIAKSRAVQVSELPDPDARNANLGGAAPATDEDRAIDESGEWLVIMGVCTHLGCVPIGNQGEYEGWYCPCHGSHYDLSGRIRKGPAPTNLPVPEVAFVDGTLTLLEEYKG